jgi:hypothetical protein
VYPSNWQIWSAW